MLDTLQLVFGAVATKDIQPVLTHVLIYPGRLQGGDGIITIDAPFDCDLPTMAVPGQKFLNSVIACDGTPKLAVTDGGKMSIKKGSFKAYLSTLPAENFPMDEKKGEPQKVPDTFLLALKSLRPFVSKDASRPWSMGIKFSGCFCFATNNIVLARLPIDWTAPDIVLPAVAINALIEMRELPSTMYVEEGSATFEYNDGSWLKTRTTTAEWPNVEAMLEKFLFDLDPVPEGLLAALRKVKKFCTNVKFPQVTLSEEGVSSDDGGGDIASVEGLKLHKSLFNADMLELVLESATHVDFSGYPSACTFSGADNLVGLFIGVKP